MTMLDAAGIRERRRQNPQMRERDFSRIHGIPEAALVAASIGEGAVRLDCDVAALLAGLPALGEVMALTRNDSAVHEKIGVYEKASIGPATALVLGEDIDLRIFPRHWRHAFAVRKTGDDGTARQSIQIFDEAGEAVHKVHLRDSSDQAAYHGLVAALTAADQSQAFQPAVPEPAAAGGAPAGRAELRAAWRSLKDTHQFFGMLKRLHLGRLQALRMIDRALAFPLAPDAVATLLRRSAATALPIMAFVGNSGCIQIHSGPVETIRSMGPWLNVFDPKFHLHLRLDLIAETWLVRKPTAQGHVTSVEAYAADGELIIQFFGVRHEGVDERPDWRRLAEGLEPSGTVPA